MTNFVRLFHFFLDLLQQLVLWFGGRQFEPNLVSCRVKLARNHWLGPCDLLWTCVDGFLCSLVLAGGFGSSDRLVGSSYQWPCSLARYPWFARIQNTLLKVFCANLSQLRSVLFHDWKLFCITKNSSNRPFLEISGEWQEQHKPNRAVTPDKETFSQVHPRQGLKPQTSLTVWETQIKTAAQLLCTKSEIYPCLIWSGCSGPGLWTEITQLVGA